MFLIENVCSSCYWAINELVQLWLLVKNLLRVILFKHLPFCLMMYENTMITQIMKFPHVCNRWNTKCHLTETFAGSPKWVWVWGCVRVHICTCLHTTNPAGCVCSWMLEGLWQVWMKHSSHLAVCPHCPSSAPHPPAVPRACTPIPEPTGQTDVWGGRVWELGWGAGGVRFILTGC